MEAGPKQITFYTTDRKKVLISSSWGSVLVKIFLALIVINLTILNLFLLKENFAFDKARDIATQSAEIMVSGTTKPKYFSPVVTNYTPAVPVSKNFEHKIEYIEFPGTQGTNSTTWWSVPGMEVNFNIANYLNYTVWWGAYLWVNNGAGKAFARLFDTQANIPIEGSEIETSSGSLVQVSSKPLKFYPGYRTYRVQIKSLLGPEAVIEDAKIKISWIEE